jgi:uncharacterized protein YndB with AHSA1/START domain
MSARSTEHASFVVERTYDAAPHRVFAAWAEPAAKQRWFSGPDGSDQLEYTLDFRIGGREISRIRMPDDPTYTYDAYYHDIVVDERIVYAYTMDRDDTRISVSVATVEFEPAGAGTRLIFTEQDVLLDGHDKVEYREHGTISLLDSLAEALRDVPTSASAS